MVVVLDDGALEPALPNVATAPVAAMVALGVRDEEALHQSADRGLERADQEVDVVGHEAVAVERERPSLLQIADRPEESSVVLVIVEHRGAVVAPVDDVVDEVVVDGTQGARHGDGAKTQGIVLTVLDPS